ncbi:MAG: 2-C-methyl-D-erythritol 2,4-cyclodiphosphate synthase [Nevskiales bacterium]
MRIGHGYDVHRFGPGDHVMLAGHRIAADFGVIAHSDGDVLIHALCDALLGAACLGDIGRHFPDTDSQWAGADSRELLKQVYQQVCDKGLRLANADLTLVAERPKVAAHIPAMQASLAAVLDCQPDQINLKATTTEGMGFIGQREGLAAHAVVLLSSE